MCVLSGGAVVYMCVELSCLVSAAKLGIIANSVEPERSLNHCGGFPFGMIIMQLLIPLCRN